MPQAPVDHGEGLHPLEGGQGRGRQLGTPVQVDGAQGLHAADDRLHGRVRDPVALADVEHLQARQVLGDPTQPGVRDGAGREGEGDEAGDPGGQVDQRGVGDPITEGDVEPAEAGRRGGGGQEAEADITDVVTGPEVEIGEAGHPRQVLEPRVRHAEAEA